jgi:hypothetical protein
VKIQRPGRNRRARTPEAATAVSTASFAILLRFHGIIITLSVLATLLS